jgi:hypothetical protein
MIAVRVMVFVFVMVARSFRVTFCCLCNIVFIWVSVV